jgi:26-hydroxylase
MGAQTSSGLRSAASLRHINSRIQSEVTQLLLTISQDYYDKPIDPSGMIHCLASNVVCSMLMSTRFRHDDPKFRRFMHLFDEGFRLFVETGMMTFIPVLKYLPGVRNTCAKLRANRDEMVNFVRSIVDLHRQELDPENPRDLIDAYLIKEAEAAQNPAVAQEFYAGYDPQRQLEQIILDVFSAGVETVSNTVLWCLVFMLRNPDKLEKMRAELESVVGSDRMPNAEDINRLPYVRASIYESLRRSSIVPMGVTHSCERTTEFEGFTLPPNTHVVPLLHAVHMSPEHWDEPEKFQPERFLSPDGTSVVRPEAFMPFSAGARVCPGDQLAEKEVFLIFASLIHTFHISSADNQLPELEGVSGATVRPKDFRVRFVPVRVEALAAALSSWRDKADEDEAGACRLYG